MKTKRMKKLSKALAIFMTVFMLMGMMPTMAFADGEESGYIYISVSYNGQYIDDKNGASMAYVPVPFDEVESIDLGKYDLSDYSYDEDGDGTTEVTALQLIIYAHENIYGGDFDDVIFTGDPGSSYFQGGVFGFDENLNYYHNGEYPLAGEGWGATSDQIVLEAGDYIDMAAFSNWDFYADSNYGFHFFADENGAFTHNYTVEADKAASIKLVRSFSGMGSGAAVYDEPDYTVSYGTSLYDAAGTVTTDGSGCADITFPTAGTWYLWADGGYGAEFPGSIVSAPAYAIVTVTAPDDPDPDDPDKVAVDAVISRINAIGEVKLTETCEVAITAAREAYEALSDELKAKVTNYITLTEAEDKLDELKVENVVGLIDAIKKVELTETCEAAITVARNAYDALATTLQGQVDNYSTLTAAENKLKKLKIENVESLIDTIGNIEDITLDNQDVIAAITAARNAYDALATTLQGQVTNYSTLTAAEDKLDQLTRMTANVVELINAIGEVKLTETCEAAITAAREAYNALSDELKAKVTNYITLTEAEDKLDELKVENVVGLIDVDEIKTVTLDSEDAINAAREAYNALSDELKAEVTNYITLTAAEIQLQNLKDIANVVELIEAIDPIEDINIASADEITAARTAYDALDSNLQGKVTNYVILTAAEEALASLKADKEAADKVIDAIANLGTIDVFSGNKVSGVRAQYKALSPRQQGFVTNEDVLLNAEKKLAELYENPSKVDHKAIYDATNKYLLTLGTPEVGSIGGE